MGAIEVLSRNIITLGCDMDNSISDEELREWATEHFEINEHLQEWYTLEGYIKFRAQQDYNEMSYDVENDYFRWCRDVIDWLTMFTDLIKVRIVPGCYSGFSVEVNICDWNYFDDYNEKEMAMDDVKDVQKLLNKLVDDYGLVVVSPGWCSTWSNYEETKKAIKKAMAELRRQIKSIPCWSRYRKGV